MHITPYQCRAARGLLNISRQDLTNLSGVCLSDINELEDVGDQNTSSDSLRAIRTTFERLGFAFWDSTISWSWPFSVTLTRAMTSLRNDVELILTPPEIPSRMGCSRKDMRMLKQLQLIRDIDRSLALTEMGQRLLSLRQPHEASTSRRVIMPPSVV